MIGGKLAVAVEGENADFLRREFLRARYVFKSRLEAKDGSYDIFRIRELLRGFGVEADGHGVVEREAAVREGRLIAPGRTVELQFGSAEDHYVFGDERKRSRDCWAYAIDDAKLSFDVTRPGQPEIYVFDGRDRLVNGLFFGATPFLESPRVHFDRPAIFADDFFVNFNICHLLFDKLPRYVTGRGLEPSAVGLLFATNDYTSSLASLLGGALVGLAAGGRRGTVSTSRLVVFSNSFVGLSHPLQNGAPSHVQVIDELRDAAARLGAGTGERGSAKVMIDRNGASARRLVNQDELVPELARRGFALVDAGALAPRDQMMRFAQTRVLMGVHGAGLANLAFMPAGSEVIELFPQLSATRAYAEASQHLGLRYRYLVLPDPELGWVSSADVTQRMRHHRRDVTAPPELFTAFLDAERDAIARDLPERLPSLAPSAASPRPKE